MQNIDKICPAYLSRRFLKRPPKFLFFEIETCFFVCNPIFGSSMSVQKGLSKKSFPRNHRGGAYKPPPPAWNKLYQSPRGIELSSAERKKNFEGGD